MQLRRTRRPDPVEQRQIAYIESWLHCAPVKHVRFGSAVGFHTPSTKSAVFNGIYRLTQPTEMLEKSLLETYRYFGSYGSDSSWALYPSSFVAAAETTLSRIINGGIVDLIGMRRRGAHTPRMKLPDALLEPANSSAARAAWTEMQADNFELHAGDLELWKALHFSGDRDQGASITNVVGTVDGEFVCSATLCRSYGGLHIANLAVKSGCHGRGMGSAFLAQLHRRHQMQPDSDLSLVATRDTARFFEKNGFNATWDNAKLFLNRASQVTTPKGNIGDDHLHQPQHQR